MTDGGEVDPAPTHVAGGGLLSWLGEITGLVHHPAPEERVPVVTRAPAAPLRPGEPFCVLSWNIQFAGTRKQNFFYDGGKGVSVPPEDLQAGLGGIAALLDEHPADLVLLQEVDRGSRRTGELDELATLVEHVAPADWASAPYHRSRYVPAPRHETLGRVEMHLAVLSRFRQASARRIQLPLLSEPRWRRAFNLKRCLLDTTVPIEGWDVPLHVAVTHLSAFSRADGTLPRQVAVLAAWMEARERAGEPFVLAGDLNMLPPGDVAARLHDAHEYADHPSPIERLIPRFRSAIPAAHLLDPQNRTYLPFGAVVPDRVLDYLFVSDGIEVLAAAPVWRPDPISDHLPLVASLRLLRPPVRPPPTA